MRDHHPSTDCPLPAVVSSYCFIRCHGDEFRIQFSTHCNCCL